MVDTRKLETEGAYFGILTSIITIVSFVVGLVSSGNTDRAEIISSIVSMSIADSMADAYGIYISNKAQSEEITDAQALRGAAYAFISKVICQLSFILPFFLIRHPQGSAMACAIWGIVIIIFISKYIAKTSKESWGRSSIRILGVTGFTTVLCVIITKWIMSIKHKFR